MLKTILLSLFMGMSVYSQEPPTNNSGEKVKPLGINTVKVFRTILSRFHTLDFANIIAEMENSGQQIRVLNFSTSGAFVFDHEFNAKISEPQTAGRNAGFQLVPFTIELNEDMVYFSAAAAGFKNMNSNVRDASKHDNRNHSVERDFTGNFWKVVDNMELVKFEYRRDELLRRVEEFRVNGDIDGNLDPLDLSGNATFFSIKFGASPIGFQSSRLNFGQEDELTIRGFETALRYGAEFNHSGKRGARYTLGGIILNRWSFNNLGLGLEQKDGSSFDGGKRFLMLARPYAEFSHRVTKKTLDPLEPQRNPIRIGLRFEGYLPLKDRFYYGDENGSINLERKDFVPKFGKFSVFLNF